MSIIPHLYDIQSTLFFEDLIKKHLLPRSKYINYVFVDSVGRGRFPVMLSISGSLTPYHSVKVRRS